jgi:[acyl-carrier-protein] S-malonyltransferase
VSLAVIFPGQGAQAPGLGTPWIEHPAFAVVAEAERASGLDLAHLLLHADETELADTRSSQLVVLLASLVAWCAAEPSLRAEGVVAMAGHSLGQITALIASGTLGLADGIRLAVARADATAASQKARRGGLVALLAADEALAVRSCAHFVNQAWVANLNAPGQVVVGGDEAILDALAATARSEGARRAKRLGVDGAFHTPLMTSAAEALAPLLSSLAFGTGDVPIVANDDGRAVSDPNEWSDRLRKHLVSPVRWTDSVATLVALGASAVVEVGPGTTLTSLVTRIDPNLGIRNIASPDDLALDVRR